MARLWRTIDGEPWMVNPGRPVKNPRLGILGLLNPAKSPGRGKDFNFHGSFKKKSDAVKREKQIPDSFVIKRRGEFVVLTRNNPKEKRSMPRRSMKRHMAWVRSFQHNRRRRRYAMTNRRRRRSRRNYRRNPYPLAGAVTSLAAGNPRRRRRRYFARNRRHRRNYRRNPGMLSRSYFGLPSLQTVGWSVVGFSGAAALNGFLGGLVPAAWSSNADGSVSKISKYVVLAGSVAAAHMLARTFRPSAAEVVTIGAGLYAASVIIHDFLPGTLPGLQAYTPLHAYTPIHGMRAYHAMPQLASQNIGATNLPVGWASHGAMDILPQRLRRFN